MCFHVVLADGLDVVQLGLELALAERNLLEISDMSFQSFSAIGRGGVRALCLHLWW